MTKPHSQMVTINLRGRTLQLEAQWIAPERADASLIVFLHEWLGSISMWKEWPQRLCDATGWRAKGSDPDAHAVRARSRGSDAIFETARGAEARRGNVDDEGHLGRRDLEGARTGCAGLARPSAGLLCAGWPKSTAIDMPL